MPKIRRRPTRPRLRLCALPLLLPLCAVPFMTTEVRAQEAQNWTAQLVVQPYPSPFISAWERNPHVAILTVVYTGRAPRDFRIEGRAQSLERGFVARARSAPQHFPGGPLTQIFTAQEVLSWHTVENDPAVFDQVLRTGVLPEGRYRLCARIVGEGDVPLTEACADFAIELPAPPQLIAPANRSTVPARQPAFQWTPVLVPPDLGVSYRFRLVERLPGQTAASAMERNRAIHEQVVPGAPLLLYPQDGLPLEEGREYAWQVEALDGSGLPITAGGRRSEIWTFSPGDPLNPRVGVLPDTLVLVPGVAILTGISRARVMQSGPTYVLDGDVRVEMLTPEYTAIDVRAESLTLDPATLPAPTWVSGRLTGTFNGGPSAGPVEFTSLVFEPSRGLTLRADVQLGAARVPLSGDVRVTTAGLQGRLVARGSGAPLVVLGGEPVRYDVDELEFTFPDRGVRAQGRLHALGREARGCGRVDFTPGARGPFTAAVDCALDARFELAPVPGGVSMALARVRGWLAGDLSAGRLDYDLGMDGTLAIAPPGMSSAYRFDVDVRAANGAASLSRLVASGATTIVAGDDAGPVGGAPRRGSLDDLRLRAEGVVAPRFNYVAGGGWDFALRFEGSASLPRFEMVALPRVGVTVDGTGIEIEGFSTTFINAPTAELGGFSVRPLGAAMSPVSIRWNDGIGARVALTADLEVGFVAGVPQPLASVRMIGRGLGYSNGAFTGSLELQRYDPWLRIRMPGSDDMEFRLRALSGELREDGGAQQVSLYAAGSLLVPDFMRCGALPDDVLELNGTIALTGRGHFSGSVAVGDLACPLAFGPLTVGGRSAQLVFGSAGTGPTVELDLTADVTLPGAAPGTRARGTGSLGLDLTGPAIVRGSVDITDPVRIDLPAADPFLSFVVQQARLGVDGLTIGGTGALLLDAAGTPTTVAAQFTAFTLGLPELRPVSGSARVSAPLAFRIGVDEAGVLSWATTTPAPGATPVSLVVDANGARVEGTAALMLSIAGRDVPLSIVFSRDFRMAVDSTIAVTSGRASLRRDTTEIAWIDEDGFWLTGNLDFLDDLFPGFQVPDRLPLPTEEVAYLELKRNGTVAVDVSMGPAGIRLATKPGETLDLVVPALSDAGGAPRTVAATFALTVSPDLAVRSGSASAVSNGGVLFRTTQSGLHVDITGLRYEGEAGTPHRFILESAAEVPLVDGTTIRVTGELEHGGSGLAGTLRAAGAAGARLVELRTDVMHVLVDSAKLVLPELDYDVRGAMRVFGRDANCTTAFTGPRDAQGALVASVGCLPELDVPLSAAAPDVALRVNALTGSVTLDPAASVATHTLSISSGITLARNAAGERTCGADFAVVAANGGLAVDPASVTVQCSGGDRRVGFGWLDALPENLAIERLTYTDAAGFDFRLRLDLDLNVRDAFAVRGMTSVVADTAGVHLPALDAPLNHAPVTLAGFGIRATRVRTQPFLIPWSDWQGRSLGDFEVELEAQLSMPELPQGFPACLATASFQASTVSINRRRLRVELPGHTFSPACSITLDAVAGPDAENGDAAARSASLTGAEGDLWAPRPPSAPLTAAQAQALYQQESLQLQAMEDTLRNRYFAADCDSTCRAALDARADSLRESIHGDRFRRELGGIADQVAAVFSAASASGTQYDHARVMQLMDSASALVLPKLLNAQDCSDAQYHLRTYLSIERQRQLLGAPESDVPPAVMAALDTCAQQRRAELVQACQLPGNAPALQWAISTALATERNRQLLGGADSGVAGEAAACAQFTGGSTGSGMAMRRPGAGGALAAATPPAPAVAQLLDWEVEQLERAGGGPSAAGAGMVALARTAVVSAPAESHPVAQWARQMAGAAASAASAPAPGSVRIDIERFGGALVIGFGPEPVLEQAPWIEGALVLPEMFECAAGTSRVRPMQNRLRMGPYGDISGTVYGLVPGCPIDLAAVKIQVTESSLTFNTARGEQTALLRGGATASFSDAASGSVNGSGSIAIDLLRGTLVDGELAFQGPFRMDLPRAQPVLSFELGSARLNSTGLHLHGRGALLLGRSARVGASLDQVRLDPRTLELTAGQVTFDHAFALEAGLDDVDEPTWSAVAAGSDPAVQTGARLDLPAQTVLTTNGLATSGGGAARLRFGGQDLATLTATFTSDFRLALHPARVSTGSVDLQLNGSSVGYIDATGFHPNLLAFGLAALPARLPLPSEDVAYLELRDANGTLRVDVQNEQAGIRIRTLNGMVPLVVPALRLDAPTDPRVDVQLDVLLDPATAAVSSGSVTAAVTSAPGFDLGDVPFIADSISYSNDGSGYRLTLGGRLALFGSTQGAQGSIRLTLDGSGRLTGSVQNLALQQQVQLVPGAENLTMALQNVSGWFDARLLEGQRSFEFDIDASLRLADAGTTVFAVPATVRATSGGVQVTQLQVQGTQPFELPAGEDVQLRLANPRVPVLGYTRANGWDFELLFDAALVFPKMDNLTIGPVRDIMLRRSGFAIPAWEVADLDQKLSIGGIGATQVSTEHVPYPHLLPALPDTLKFGGFTFAPLAFRMDALEYDWFAGGAPAHWGFGFDFEISFSELHAQAPAALKDMKLRLLDAGLRNGRPSGRLERLEFAESIEMGIGRVAAVWGWIMPPPEERPPAEPEEEEDPDEPVIIHMEVGVDLYSPIPVCPAAARVKNVHNDTLSVSSEGWFGGRILGVTPTCPQDIGPFRFEFGTSELRFRAGSQQQFEIFTTGTIKVAGIAADTVSGSGFIRFDGVAGEILDGRIELNKPFRWQPKDGNPFMTFDVNSAVLDRNGFRFDGGGSLRLEGGANATVSFNQLVLDLPTLEIKAGDVTFVNQVALGTTIDANGALSWGAFAPTAPRPAGWGFRTVAPAGMVLDARGLSVTGSASAELSFADTVFQVLSVDFVNGFRIAMHPLGIRSGRADFMYNQSRVAHADSLGFWPGDVFAALPVPDTLNLGGRDVAYIVLRDPTTGLLNVETEANAAGYRLKSRANQALRLEVPALAGNGQTAPAADVSLDVVVNSTTFQVASGAIRATSPAQAPPLMSLQHIGVPLDVREVAWDRTGPNGAYALSIDAHLQLPPGMCPSTAPLAFNDVAVTSAGLSGTISIGTLVADSSTAAVVTCVPSSDLTVELVGAEVTLGGQNPGVQLAGRLRTPVFSRQDGSIAAIAFDGTLTSAAGLQLNVDPTAVGKLPLGVATFQPAWLGTDAPVRVVANASEFAVIFNGVFGDVPTLPSSFGLSVANLSIGTQGVSLAGLGLTGDQELELWNATLRLKTSTCNNATVPALSGSYTNGVFRMELAGELDFMENTSTFCGLRIASDGTLTLASANLLSQPVHITPDVVVLQSLRVENTNLLGTIAVAVPEPLAPASAPPQLVHFSVAPNGTVTGGGTVVVINDATPGLGNDSTEYAIGDVLTVDPRWLGVTLDFNGFRQNSKVRLVSDFYLAGNAQNLIRLGDISGQTVAAGLTIGFDGKVTWGNVSMPNPFTFDYEIVKLTVANVTASGTGLNDFAIGFDGGLGLSIAQVSGAVGFTGASIRSNGEVRFGTLQDGAFSIAGVASLGVSGFRYVNRDTTITVSGGGMPVGNSAPNAATETITVDRFLRFGGSIEMAGAFSGGIDDFIVYRTAATSAQPSLTSFIVSGASMALQGGVVKVAADLRYRELPQGFEMLVGGTAEVVGTAGITVVGAMEKQSNAALRAGIFLAANNIVGLNLTPATPVAGVTGLGGGFFLNPKEEWLEVVRSQAIPGAPAGWDSAPVGSFAVLLYGALGTPVPPADVIQGRVLLTIMPTALQMDGLVTVLGQTQVSGVGRLVVAGPANRAKLEGNIEVGLNYGGLLNGHANARLLAGLNPAGQKIALLTAQGQITAVGYLTGNGQLAAGDFGFMAGVSMGNLPSLGAVSLKSADATVFYVAPARNGGTPLWGGVATIEASAGPIPAFSPVDVSLTGAIITEGLAIPVLYAMGELQVNYIVDSWSGSVWAKIQDGKVDAGFGSDPAMMALIQRAVQLAGNIEAQKQQLSADIASINMPPIALTPQELVTLFNGMSTQASSWGRTSLSDLKQLEISYPQANWIAPYWTYIDKYTSMLSSIGHGCCDTTGLAIYRDTAVLRRNGAVANRAALQQKIAAIQLALSAAGVAPRGASPNGGVSASFAVPAEQATVINGDTTVMLSGGPALSVDPVALNALNAALLKHDGDVAELERRTVQQIEELDQMLGGVRAALNDGAGSAVQFASDYAGVVSALERQHAAYAARMLHASDFGKKEHFDLIAAQSTFQAQMNAHLDTLAANPAVHGLRLRALALNRAKLVDEIVYGGADMYRAQFLMADALAAPGRWTALKQLASQTGWMLWYTAGHEGTLALDTASMRIFRELRPVAYAQVDSMRQEYTRLSEVLEPLHQGHAELTATLHDLVDRYLVWKGVEAGRSQLPTLGGTPRPSRQVVAQVSDTVAQQLQRRARLAADLQVPTVTNAHVTTVTTRHHAELTFRWNGTAANGTASYLFRDHEGGNVGLGPVLWPSGSANEVRSYRFRHDHGAGALPRTLHVGVRGGAGFIGYGTVPFTFSYLPETSTSTHSTTAGVMQPDSTPPAAPSVWFPGLVSDGTVAWTNDPTGFVAHWSAADAQSGISEYQYAVGSAPGDSTLRGWTGMGGRTSIRIERIGLSPAAGVVVSVRARNGSGFWSPVGSSVPVRLDEVAPYFAPGASLQLPGASLIGTLPGTAFGFTPPPTPACAVPLPAYPTSSGSGLVAVGGASVGGLPLQPAPEPVIPTDPIVVLVPTPTGGAPARISLARPAGFDDGSGVHSYAFRVDTIPTAVYTAQGWTTITSGSEFTVSGAPLNYSGVFYVSVVVIDRAGNGSAPIHYGPFTPEDTSPPTTPEMCATSGAGVLRARFTTPSTDDETGVAGYRYRVRSGSGAVLRDWGTGIDWQPVSAGGTRSTAQLGLQDGSTYFVDAVAVNGQGRLSGLVRSGAVLYDATPPAAPVVQSLFAAHLNNRTTISITLGVPNDPHSGTTHVQYAIGTSSTSADLIAWTTLNGPFANNAVTISVPQGLYVDPTRTYHLRVRSVNGAGLASAMTTTTFTVQ